MKFQNFNIQYGKLFFECQTHMQITLLCLLLWVMRDFVGLVHIQEVLVTCTYFTLICTFMHMAKMSHRINEQRL